MQQQWRGSRGKFPWNTPAKPVLAGQLEPPDLFQMTQQVWWLSQHIIKAGRLSSAVKLHQFLFHGWCISVLHGQPSKVKIVRYGGVTSAFFSVSCNFTSQGDMAALRWYGSFLCWDSGWSSERATNSGTAVLLSQPTGNGRNSEMAIPSFLLQSQQLN